MTRPPLDATPQRQLVDELRVLIDRGHARDVGRLRDLIDANPRSIHARYVRHNIGQRRAAVLDIFMQAGGAFARLSPEERAVVGDASDYDWRRSARSRTRGRA